MMISNKTLFTVALLAGTLMLGSDAFAQVSDAGSSVLGSLEDAITGNIGLIVGLCLAVLGIWTWVVRQETAAGILLIIGGVLITITPGVFNTIGDMVAPIVETAGGSNVDAATGAELGR